MRRGRASRSRAQDPQHPSERLLRLEEPSSLSAAAPGSHAARLGSLRRHASAHDKWRRPHAAQSMGTASADRLVAGNAHENARTGEPGGRRWIRASGDCGSMVAFTVNARIQQSVVEPAAVAGLAAGSYWYWRAVRLRPDPGASRGAGGSRRALAVSVIGAAAHDGTGGLRPGRRGGRTSASTPVLPEVTAAG